MLVAVAEANDATALREHHIVLLVVLYHAQAASLGDTAALPDVAATRLGPPSAVATRSVLARS